MIADGRNMIGSKVQIPIGSNLETVEIVDSVFYDKENMRRDG